MEAITTHAPGTFSWINISATNQHDAASFYSQLFGWDAEEVPTGPDSTFFMLFQKGHNIGGLSELTAAEREQGIPPHWLPFVTISSADAMAERVRALGGTVMEAPFDVMEHGRMAVVQDPTGAVLALWEPRNHIGAGVLNEPGAVCWTELATRDTEAAKAFFTDLFGWKAETSDMEGTPYTVFSRSDGQAGGLFEISDDWGEGIPPHWMTYIGVTDCAGTCERAKELGGQVIREPHAVPGIGTFAILQDPQCAVFSVIQMESFGG